MVEAVSENKTTFVADFLKQLSLVGKVLFRPVPSTFRSILDYPNIKITVTIVLLMIARLGANIIELIRGGEFFDQRTIAIPLFLLLLAFKTSDMCKDFFRGQNFLFKQLFLALVAVYFASVFVNGALTGLTLILDRFQDVTRLLVLAYQVVLAVMAVYAIASLNLWKSTFAVMISGVIAGLGVGISVSTIGSVLFFMFEGLF